MKKKCAFLFDHENNWIRKKFIKIDLKSLKKYTFRNFYDYKKIKGYDIIFILGYTKILPKKFIERNNLSLTIHNSDLPNYRGFSPLQWQILANKKKFAMCLIKIEEKVDRGPIILKEFLKLNGTELYEEIRNKQFDLIVKLIKKFLKKFPHIEMMPQKKTRGSFFRKRKSSDQKLDISKSIKKQFNLLRIANNYEWPCYFEFNNKRYKILIFKDDKKNFKRK